MRVKWARDDGVISYTLYLNAKDKEDALVAFNRLLGRFPCGAFKAWHPSEFHRVPEVNASEICMATSIPMGDTFDDVCSALKSAPWKHKEDVALISRWGDGQTKATAFAPWDQVITPWED